MLKHSIAVALLVVTATHCATLPPQYQNAPAAYELNKGAAEVTIIEFIPSG